MILLPSDLTAIGYWILGIWGTIGIVGMWVGLKEYNKSRTPTNEELFEMYRRQEAIHRYRERQRKET